jgi:hypothetical protein
VKVSNPSLSRRALLAFFLTISLSIFGLAPSQAVFGLGTCEKIKNEITAIEKKINKEIAYWNSHLNEAMSQQMLSRRENFENQKYPYQVWKVAYNNPKCFSRTQNIEIERRTGYDAKYNLWGVIAFRSQSTSYGADCKGLPTYTIDLGKYGGKSKVCNIPPRLIVQETRTFQSVYSF